MGKFRDYYQQTSEAERRRNCSFSAYASGKGLRLPEITPEMEFTAAVYSPLVEMTDLLDQYDKENYNEAFGMALLGEADAKLINQSIAGHQQQLQEQLAKTSDQSQRDQITKVYAQWQDLMDRVTKQQGLSSQKMRQYENFAEFRQSENWYLDEKIARIAAQAQSGDNSNSWFKGSNLFSDGYQFGDVAKTIGATTLDVGQEAVEGVGRFAEHLIDAAVYAGGAAYGAFGNEEAKIGAQTYIEHSLDWDKIGRAAIPGRVDGDSVLGGKSDGLVNSLGEMAVKKVADTFVPGSGMVFTAISSFGAEAENALRHGASYSEAGVSALISAGAETLTEKLFGGSGIEGKGLINTQSFTKNLSAGLLKTMLDYGIDILGEGAEEIVSQFISNFGSALYREENLGEILFSKEALQEYMDSFVGGAVMGGLFNVGKALGTLPTKTKGWTDYHTGLTADQQKQFNQEYKARIAQATSNGTRLNSKARGAIYDAALANVKSGNPLVFSSVEAGVPDGPNPTGAPSVVNAAIAAVREGGTVTNAMATTIVDNPAAVSYLTEQTGMELPDTMSGKRNAVKQAVSKLAEGLTNTAQAAVNEAQTAAVSEGDSGAVGAQEGSEGASGGTGARAVRFAKGNNGKLAVQTSDGSAVDVDQAEFGSEDEAVVYHTVAKLATNAPAANLMLSTYEGSDVPAMTFAKGVEEAFVYGSAGIPLEQAMERGSFISELKDYQVRTAYKLGRMEGGKQTAREQAAVRRSKDAKAADTSEGKVHFDGDRSKLNKTQRASLDVMEMLAKSLGIQIYVENWDGTENANKNGWYDLSDGSIHINLNAGMDGKGTMLFAVAHELTHFIRQWSPAKFKVLANFLMKQYGEKGVSVQELIDGQIAKAKADGRELSFKEAYEEVVADSMEAMLTDGNVAQWMSELKQQEKGLWEKIRDWFKDLAGKLRAAVDAYKGVTPDSTEGKLVADMKDVIGILESLYQDALVDASENYSAAGAQKNTAHEGGVKYSLKDVKIPTRNELEKKNPVAVVDISAAQTKGNFAERRSKILKDAEEIISKPYLNRDTKTLIFLTKQSYTHAFNNLGDIQLNAAEHLPELIENAVLTHAESPTHGSDYTDGVYTFFAAARTDSIVPVKLKVKEYSYVGQLLPRNIRDYFDSNPGEYASSYDTVVLEVDEIEKSPSGSVGDITKDDVAPDPDELSTIKISDLLSLVKGDSEKYLPKLSARDPDYQKVNQVLEQENAKLKEDVSYLKELVKIQRTVTNGTKVTKSSVESAAGYLKKAAGAKGNTAELAAVLKPFYEYIASEKELTWEGVKEQAQPAVEWLRDHVEVKKERSEYAQDILKQLQGSRIYLDESQMAEAAHHFGSYNDYRKSLFGTLTLSKDANTSLDSLWQELSAMYPDVFDGDTTSTDMPSALADAIHRLRNADMTTLEYARDRVFIEQELLQQVYDSYWRVSTMHTVADVKQRQINRLKGEHFQRMEKLKRHHREQVDKLKQGHKERLEKVRQEYRDRADAKIADIKQKYQESRSKSVESRKKTELRRKIRKTIRELSKLLEHGTKERNVKQGMREFASKAIASAEILFADDASNEDLIRNGIGADMSVDEEKLVQQCVDLMKQIDGMSGYDTLQQREALERKLKSNLSALRPVLERERARINKIPVDAAFDGLAKAYKALEKSDHAYIRNAFDDATYQYLSSMGETLQGSIIKDMSTEQLETLHKAYTLVLTKIRNANKGFVDGRAIDGTAKQLLREMESGKPPKSERGALAQNLANKMGWDYEKLYYALDRIGSETLTRLFNNLADSENVVMADVQEAKAFLLDMVEKYGYNDWPVNQKLDREFVDNTGKKFRLTLGEIMSLYAYSRRADAWDHFEVGGFVFSKTKLKDINPAATYKLTKEQCEGITGLLTKEQRSFAEEMQKFLSETMGGKGNEVSMQMYGIEMFGEENYFPIHTSGDFKAAADEARAKDAAGFASMSNAGFTKARQKGSVSPVMLDGFLEVWVDHVNEMSRYHGTVPALEDIRRVMNYSSYVFAESESTSVKAAMKNHFGKEAVQYFDALYREANSGAVFDKLQKKQKWLLSRFRKNSVAYSLSVLVQQPASLSRAFAVIDKRHFNGFFHIPGLRGVGALPKGIGKMLSNHWTKAFSDNYNEMLKYAPGVTLAKEIGGFDTATGGSIRSYLLDTDKGLRSSFKTEPVAGKVKAVAELVDDNPVANLPNAADKLAWVAIWEACKHETVGLHPDLRPGSPEFLKIAGQRFTEVIRATQVYDSIFAKSPLLRSKNIGVQFAVSFMNEPNTTANMVEAAIRSFSKGERVKGSKLATAALRSVLFACVMKSIVYALRDDDEEETYLEKYIEAFTGSLLSDITIFNYIPFSRDIWSAAQGYDVERPDMVIVGDFMAIVGRLAKLHDTDASEMSEAQLEEHEQKITEAWWKLLDSTAAIFGVPVKNVRREINAVLDHAEIASRNSGKFSWRGIRDAIEQGIADASPVFAKPDVESYAEKFYEALINGDQNYVDRHTGGFKGKGLFYYFKAITNGSKDAASKVYRYLVQQKENSGMTTDEAENSIKSGLKTQCRDHYEDGKISGDDAMELLVEYCGVDKEDANADVAYWQYKLDHPDADTYAQWFDIYFEKIEDSGIELDTFLEYRTQRSGLTKRDEILDVIDALPISDDQKDALYFAEGYAESTLHKAPWR